MILFDPAHFDPACFDCSAPRVTWKPNDYADIVRFGTGRVVSSRGSWRAVAVPRNQWTRKDQAAGNWS